MTLLKTSDGVSQSTMVIDKSLLILLLRRCKYLFGTGGTVEQKQKLSSKLLGVSVSSVREAFKASATSYPCVYLCTLNTVGKLRKTMKIDNKYTDDMLVCKYGFTSDLSRRLTEHEKLYGKLKGCELAVKHYSIVDPMYVSDAETDIKDYFEALNIFLKYKNYDELVIVKQSLFKSIEKQYKQITSSYAGHMKKYDKRYRRS